MLTDKPLRIIFYVFFAAINDNLGTPPSLLWGNVRTRILLLFVSTPYIRKSIILPRRFCLFTLLSNQRKSDIQGFSEWYSIATIGSLRSSRLSGRYCWYWVGRWANGLHLVHKLHVRPFRDFGLCVNCIDVVEWPPIECKSTYLTRDNRNTSESLLYSFV